MRTDPASGRQVLIAEGREKRPTDLAGAIRSAGNLPLAGSNCPFCPGNEDQTPQELAVLYDESGRWLIRVVPNKYPAVLESAPLPPAPGTPFEARAAWGKHEVFIESPSHLADWRSLSCDHLAQLLALYAERMTLAQQDYAAAMIFKNVGSFAGASLSHIHSQLTALPFVPAALQNELNQSASYHRAEGNCLFCSILNAEVEHRERLALENEQFVAVCAYAGRQPYETWIVPRQHEADYTNTAREHFRALAELFLELLERLSRLQDSAPYNLVLHSAPAGRAYQASFHWHWEVVPRTTSLAGFEWGTGMHINPLAPERAARNLRNA